MSGMSGELKFTRKICDEMREAGAFIFPIVGSKRQQPGMPDRHVTSRHWTGYLEFKGVATPTKAHQIAQMRKINNACPFSAFLIRDAITQIEVWNSKPGVRNDLVICGVCGRNGIGLLCYLRDLRGGRKFGT